jgi:hypothetical protein
MVVGNGIIEHYTEYWNTFCRNICKLSRFRANQSLLLLLNTTVCLVEKQQIPIIFYSLWFYPIGAQTHRHLNSGPPFFLIWSLPQLWYGSLSGSISLSHLSIFYNISCYNSLVLQTFVSRSSCRFTLKKN